MIGAGARCTALVHRCTQIVRNVRENGAIFLGKNP